MKRYSNTASRHVKERWWLLGLDVVLVSGCLSAKWLVTQMMRFLPDCAFAQRGFQCPACGGTRAVASLCRGEIGSAFSYHPLVCFALLYALVLIIFLHLKAFFHYRYASVVCKVMANHWAVIGFAVCFGLFGILRNF